jgi:hypothetical protein
MTYGYAVLRRRRSLLTKSLVNSKLEDELR